MIGVNESVSVRCVCVFALCLAVTPATSAEPGTVDGLVLWLQADDVDGDGNIDTGSGARVARWSDRSGRGNHVQQGAVARQPTSQRKALGDHAVLRFDGDDCFELAKTACRPQMQAVQWQASRMVNRTEARVRCE